MSSTLAEPSWYLWVIFIQLVLMVISCNLMPLLQRLTAIAKSFVDRFLVAPLPADRGGTHSLPVRSLTEFNFELWSMELNASFRKKRTT